MTSVSEYAPVASPEPSLAAGTLTWTGRVALLWVHRRSLLRAFLVSAPLSVCIAFAIPRQYESVARIMPPDQQMSGATLIAALAGRTGSLGALGGIAGGLLGGHATAALFVDLLQSGSVSDALVNRFQLQKVYHKRYRVDAAKRLARYTKISDDKRSGVITIAVTDRDPVRARDLAQAYLDELNHLVTRTNDSSAHQERVFIEQRLKAVTADLERAQTELSEYQSKNNTIDLKEQTRAMVDAGASVQADLVMEESTLNSLRQVYGDDNIRVHEAEARIATLQRELRKAEGAGTAADTNSATNAAATMYPPLRQLPRLAVPYADLYRKVRVQEAVFELLSQQYETARIEEAKDVPAVSVIDAPGVPEKKSYPPRTLIVLLLTCGAVAGTALLVLVRARWEELPREDERRTLVSRIAGDLRAGEERAK